MPDPKIPLVRSIPAHEILNISVALDTYDDIFSDFDPRPYSKRELSLDFLREIERRRFEAGTSIEVRFLIPKDVRNKEEEAFITKRLREHFGTQKKDAIEKSSQTRSTGIKLSAIGFAIMVVSLIPSESDLLGFLLPISQVLVVASWFFLWTGLEKIFIGNKRAQRQEARAEKLRKATYLFEEFPEKPVVVKKVLND